MQAIRRALDAVSWRLLWLGGAFLPLARVVRGDEGLSGPSLGR